MLNDDLAKNISQCYLKQDIISFANIIRAEIAFSHLYEEDKAEDLRNLFGYIEYNFPRAYFYASVQALVDLLAQIEASDQFKSRKSFNYLCYSLAAYANTKDGFGESAKVSDLADTSKINNDSVAKKEKIKSSKDEKLKLEEIPSSRKIIEKRKTPGQLKVLASWYFIWNTIHQIIWGFFFAYIVCGQIIFCFEDNLIFIRRTQSLVAVSTSVLMMHLRMDYIARKRWRRKYNVKREKYE